MPYSEDDDPYRGLRGIKDAGPERQQAALLVIDMQNCFCHPEGAFAKKLGVDISNLRAAIPGCAELIEAARAAGIPVIYTQGVYRHDYRDGGIIHTEHLRIQETGAMMAGSWDAEIIEELAPEPEDFVVAKHRFSSFYGTDLEVILSSLWITSVVICGVTTNICVETTARDAAQRNYRTYVVRDATGEVDPVKHDHALSTLEYAFCRVVSRDEVIGAWSAAPTAGEVQTASV